MGTSSPKPGTFPIPPEKRAAYLDQCSIINTRGLKAYPLYARHWRRYIPAASFIEGNLTVDTARLAGRGDQPVVLSQGQPPYGAECEVDLPSAWRAGSPRGVTGRDSRAPPAARTRRRLLN
jgi:hypothetical protein